MSCMTMQGLLEEVVAHWLMFQKSVVSWAAAIPLFG